MNTIRVGPRKIGAGQPCFLVAEIGINHNGDLQLARQMIESAAQAGADAVKFQNYRTEDFITDRSLTIEYISNGRRIVEPQFDLFKRCELPPEWLVELKDCCDRHGVLFHSTPTSTEGIEQLVAIGAPLLKNGSDYLTHLPLIRAMGASGLPTVISTGMAVLGEIDEAVRAFRETGNQQLILLHCTSSYPTPDADVHLRKIPTLAAAFGCPVGFSDHSEGITAAMGAVSLGACWIEKHFTIDKSLPGPDHRFSSDPDEFKSLVTAVRRLERQLGSTVIGPAASEAHGRDHYRLSCVASRPLPSGHRIDWKDLAFRRPGTGLPPKHAHLIIGRQLKRTVRPGEPLVLGDCA